MSLFVARNNHHNERLVRYFLEKAYPTGLPTVEQLILDNILSGTQLAELAVSISTGIDLDRDGYGKDLVDNSDIKTTTIQEKYRHGLKCHIGPLQNIQPKLGTLRIITFNPFFGNWKFFKIPRRIYKSFVQIEIRFDVESGAPIGKYARYEVSSWEKFVESKK